MLLEGQFSLFMFPEKRWHVCHAGPHRAAPGLVRRREQERGEGLAPGERKGRMGEDFRIGKNHSGWPWGVGAVPTACTQPWGISPRCTKQVEEVAESLGSGLGRSHLKDMFLSETLVISRNWLVLMGAVSSCPATYSV